MVRVRARARARVRVSVRVRVSLTPMLRMAMVFGPRGVSMTALKGRSWPG